MLRMRPFTKTIIVIIWLLGTPCHSEVTTPEPQMLELKGDLRVHDPAMIRQADTSYVFSTGGSPQRGGIIPIRCSKDLYYWKRCGAVFDQLPEWATREIPGTRGAWAPDISCFNGKYHLYYSISTFGEYNSAIGLVTNRTLDPNSPDYKWEDQGMVIRSVAGRDNYNAIDGNLVLEDRTRRGSAGAVSGEASRPDVSTGPPASSLTQIRPCTLLPAGRVQHLTRSRRKKDLLKRRPSYGTEVSGICSCPLICAAGESLARTRLWWAVREILLVRTKIATIG